jgi:hypothetical protein
MPFPNVPSEAEIAREMISPAAQKRAARMPGGFRPFEQEAFSQYDPDLAMYGNPEQKMIMRAIEESPYADAVMEAGIAEASFDGSYDGLRDVFNKTLDAHYAGAATMPNFYTDRRADEETTHLDYAYDIVEIMKSLYPERAAENRMLDQKLDAFIKMGDAASAQKDPVLQRGLPIRPELITPVSAKPVMGEPYVKSREATQAELMRKAADDRISRLQGMLDEEYDVLGTKDSMEDRKAVVSNIVTIENNLKALRTQREELQRMYGE